MGGPEDFNNRIGLADGPTDCCTATRHVCRVHGITLHRGKCPVARSRTQGVMIPNLSFTTNVNPTTSNLWTCDECVTERGGWAVSAVTNGRVELGRSCLPASNRCLQNVRRAWTARFFPLAGDDERDRLPKSWSSTGSCGIARFLPAESQTALRGSCGAEGPLGTFSVIHGAVLLSSRRSYIRTWYGATNPT